MDDAGEAGLIQRTADREAIDVVVVEHENARVPPIRSVHGPRSDSDTEAVERHAAPALDRVTVQELPAWWRPTGEVAR